MISWLALFFIHLNMGIMTNTYSTYIWGILRGLFHTNCILHSSIRGAKIYTFKYIFPYFIWGFFFIISFLIYSAIHGNNHRYNNKYIAVWLRYRWVLSSWLHYRWALFYENITADRFGTAGQSQNDRSIIGFSIGT